MPLPIAHALVGAAIVTATLPNPSPAQNWKTLLIGSALSVSPDLDYFFETTQHRGFTHSLLFALIVGTLCFAVTRFAKIRVALACAAAFLSHGLLDYATTKTMPGVELFWPVTNQRFGLGLIDYYDLTRVDPVYFLYQNVASDLFKAGMIELLIFGPLFLSVLLLKWGFKRFSKS
jgi:membrane-bound metal-dependent hydrolase YbcI (DUF457 family)